MLNPGLYEQLISKLLRHQLSTSTDKLIKTAPMDSEEAPRILAKYIAEVIEQGLANVKDNGGDLESQVELANRIIGTLTDGAGEISLDGLAVDKPAELLMALIDKKNSIYAIDEKAEIMRPVTSIAESSLFTGAVHEPSMFTELKREILSCDRITLITFLKKAN